MEFARIPSIELGEFWEFHYSQEKQARIQLRTEQTRHDDEVGKRHFLVAVHISVHITINVAVDVSVSINVSVDVPVRVSVGISISPPFRFSN